MDEVKPPIPARHVGEGFHQTPTMNLSLTSILTLTIFPAYWLTTRLRCSQDLSALHLQLVFGHIDNQVSRTQAPHTCSFQMHIRVAELHLERVPYFNWKK